MDKLKNNKQELAVLFPEAFLKYSKTVITNRSLPDIAGCKPVHTAILWGMKNAKLAYNKPRTKSVTVVAETLLLHPHGDSAAYEAAVRLGSPHIMRYPLIDAGGSFGGITGSTAAHYRYTEMRPTIFADLMLQGWNKNAVDMSSGDTGNEDTLIPDVLPGVFPNILVNGNEGIAVGLACSWLPHNLNEVVDGITAYINNKNIDIKGLMEHIKGPDFPLGGTVLNKDTLFEAYSNGRSSDTLKVRGDYTVKGREVTFTSIPYGTNTNAIVRQINKNVDELAQYIDDYEDESKKDVKLIFTFKNKAAVEPGLNVLFRRTNLQYYASINMNLKIGEGFREEMSLKSVIVEYVKHQLEVIKRTYQFDLDKANERKHIYEGRKTILLDVDKVVKTIRSTKSAADARKKLEKEYGIDEIQSQDILALRLSVLTSMEIESILKELDDIDKLVKKFTSVVQEESKREEILIEQLETLKNEFGDARRTKLDNIVIQTPQEMEEIVPPTPVRVAFDKERQDLKIVARSAAGYQLIDTRLDEKIVLFSNFGNAHKLDVVDINTTSEQTHSYLDLEPGEKILDIMARETFNPVIVVANNGLVKRMNVSEFESNRKTLYTKLKDNSIVLDVCANSAGVEYIKLMTDKKKITFEVEGINTTGRQAQGVIGIKLAEGEEVVSVEFLEELGDNVLTGRNGVGQNRK